MLLAFLSLRWLPAIVPAADVTLPGIMWPALLAFSLYLSLYPWIFVRALLALRERAGPGAWLLAAPIWLLLEWIRGSGVLAFSWLHLSQSQAGPGGYLAPASWIGGLGLGFLMVLVQAAVAAAFWGERPLRGFAARVAGSACLLLALLAVPSHREGEATLKVAAVQGNVSLDDKWEPRYRMENLRVMRELSQEAVAQGAELLVWPETAFPVNLLYDRQAEQALRRAAGDLGIEIVTGYQGLAPSGTGDYLYRNAAGLLSPNGALEGMYSKEHLLPFGEFIPWAGLLAPGLDINLGQSNFTPGRGIRVFQSRQVPLAVFICYEMGYAASVRDAAAAGARLLLNITNDGWFEHPIAMELHAALSPMRAAENGLPVLRCGNSGITLICDARGRVVGRLPANRRESLVREIRIPEQPSFYARHGAWSGSLLLAAYGLAALGALPRLRRRVSSES